MEKYDFSNFQINMFEFRDEGIVRSQALHQQVYDYIKRKIIFGEVKCGTKIIESQLAKEMHISRSPIREALRMLCADELLIPSNGGIIVNPMDYQTTIEAYECRIVMDPFATRLAAERIDGSTLENLKDCLVQTEKLKGKHTKENYQKIIELNSKFHALIIYACKYHHIQRYIENNMALITLARINEFYLYHQDDSYISDHTLIYNALCEHDGDKAEECMRQHAIHDYEFYKSQYKNRVQE